jgi:hypothetical protein
MKMPTLIANTARLPHMALSQPVSNMSPKDTAASFIGIDRSQRARVQASTANGRDFYYKQIHRRHGKGRSREVVRSA